jgi:hypothetical protein
MKFGNDLLDITLKAKITKTKIEAMEYIKVK